MSLTKRWLDEINQSEPVDAGEAELEAETEAAWHAHLEETEPDYSDVEVVSDADN